MKRFVWEIGPAIALASVVFATWPATVSEAASFDCAKASTKIEKLICGNDRLSRADEALDRAYRAALVMTATPQTLRIDQRDWIANERNFAANVSDALDLYLQRIQLLRDVFDNASFVRQTSADKGGLKTKCLAPLVETAGAKCSVLASGALPGAPGPSLTYQVQEYSDADGSYAGGGAVVFAPDKPNFLTPLLWTADEYNHYDTPQLVSNKSGKWVHLPGTQPGTAFQSAEVLFLWQDGNWVEADIWSWQDELTKKLPKDKYVARGIFPDWKNMTAETSLWRDGDPNCCPGGGKAKITLTAQKNVIKLGSVKFVP